MWNQPLYRLILFVDIEKYSLTNYIFDAWFHSARMQAYTVLFVEHVCDKSFKSTILKEANKQAHSLHMWIDHIYLLAF